MIVDTQVHAPPLADPAAFGDEAAAHAAATEALLAAMDSVGVTHAIIAPRHDAAMGEYAAAHCPGRLSRVIMLDPNSDAEAQVSRAKATPSVVGLRMVAADYIGARGAADLHEGKLDPLFAAAERHGLPLFLLAPGHPADLAGAAKRFPGLTMIVDHFGLRQYPPLSMDSDPWEKLPGLLALARFPNVAVKFCGAQLLSKQHYPHDDIVPMLRRVIDAFGADRLMWASDFTRLRMVPQGEPWRGTYADALRFIVDADWLSTGERQALLARTAQTLLGWPA